MGLEESGDILDSGFGKHLQVVQQTRNRILRMLLSVLAFPMALSPVLLPQVLMVPPDPSEVKVKI